MFAAITSIFVLAAAAVHVRADPNPNNPGPGDVFVEGGSCLVGWDVDTTGLWKTMTIELMTGSNFEMVSLASVGSVDGTDATKNTFSFICPQVTPHSPIYFYQFSSSASQNKTWTGRFTITNPLHDIVPPSRSTQPDGEKIPWGIGTLVSASSTAVASATGAPSSDNATNATLVTTTTSSTPSITTSGPNNSALIVTITETTSTPSTVSTAGTSGAVATLSVSNIIFQTGVALGLAATGFVLAL